MSLNASSKSIGEQSWRSLASLLKSFRQRRKSFKKKKSVDVEKVFMRRKIMCIVRKMSAIGRGGKGGRCLISQELAELCMQGFMNEEYEPAFEEWKVWLTHKDEGKRRRR